MDTVGLNLLRDGQVLVQYGKRRVAISSSSHKGAQTPGSRTGASPRPKLRWSFSRNLRNQDSIARRLVLDPWSGPANKVWG